MWSKSERLLLLFAKTSHFYNVQAWLKDGAVCGRYSRLAGFRKSIHSCMECCCRALYSHILERIADGPVLSLDCTWNDRNSCFRQTNHREKEVGPEDGKFCCCDKPGATLSFRNRALPMADSFFFWSHGDIRFVTQIAQDDWLMSVGHIACRCIAYIMMENIFHDSCHSLQSSVASIFFFLSFTFMSLDCFLWTWGLIGAL